MVMLVVESVRTAMILVVAVMVLIQMIAPPVLMVMHLTSLQDKSVPLSVQIATMETMVVINVYHVMMGV